MHLITWYNKTDLPHYFFLQGSHCGLKIIELLLVQSYYKHELCTETYTQLIYAVDKILQKKIFCCVDFLLN